jgi:hypothetical protein
MLSVRSYGLEQPEEDHSDGGVTAAPWRPAERFRAGARSSLRRCTPRRVRRAAWASTTHVRLCACQRLVSS